LQLEKYDGIINYNSIKEFVFSMKDMSAEDGISPDEVVSGLKSLINFQLYCR